MDEKPSGHGKSCTYALPEDAFENICKNIDLLNVMDGRGGQPHIDESRLSPALPDKEAGEPHFDTAMDPFRAFDGVLPAPSLKIDEYWSCDKSFWTKWKQDEMTAKLSSTELAQAKVEEARKEATAAAAEAKEVERLRIESEKMKQRAERVDKPPVTQLAVKSIEEGHRDLASEFKLLMEEGKRFRSEFMPCWRELSLAVSTTAGNARSIQLNSTKLITALSRAAQQAGADRPEIVRWLSGVCGSKIVSQAASGNKTLVWSFVYLARIVADRFPDVAKIGIMGELASANSDIFQELSRKKLPEQPADYEMHTRVWVALICVFGCQAIMWRWVVRAVNPLREAVSYLQSPGALWNMMLVYILFDIGLYDFRRMFGSQAMMIIDLLEKTIFPRIDRELQQSQLSTSATVQLRFYLDACFNIIQSRKYASPPDGQILSATRESELNPEL